MTLQGTNKSRVLELLQQHANEWVSANCFVEVWGGYRYGDIIYKLRREGHTIDRQPDHEHRSAVHQYRLVVTEPHPAQVVLPWAEHT